MDEGSTTTIDKVMEDLEEMDNSQRNFNFTPLEKSGAARIGALERTVRVGPRQLGISGDVMKRFEYVETPSGRRVTKLAIRVDDVNQAISIGTPREGEAYFSFNNSPNVGSGYATCGKPVDMRKNHSLPTGDYVEVEHNIFVLAK